MSFHLSTMLSSHFIDKSLPMRTSLLKQALGQLEDLHQYIR